VTKGQTNYRSRPWRISEPPVVSDRQNPAYIYATVKDA